MAPSNVPFGDGEHRLGDLDIRRHSSFLLRYWVHDDHSAERIELEHIQRRAPTPVHSLAVAAEWISDQHRDADGHQPNDHQHQGRTPT